MYIYLYTYIYIYIYRERERERLFVAHDGPLTSRLSACGLAALPKCLHSPAPYYTILC